MSQTPETGQPARKRRWFRFSLRTLLLASLLAGSAMLLPAALRAATLPAPVTACPQVC